MAGHQNTLSLPQGDGLSHRPVVALVEKEGRPLIEREPHEVVFGWASHLVREFNQEERRFHPVVRVVVLGVEELDGLADPVYQPNAPCEFLPHLTQ